MTGNINSPSRDKTGKNTLIEYVEDDVYEFPDSYFSKASARVFDEIDNGKADVLSSSIFLLD